MAKDASKRARGAMPLSLGFKNSHNLACHIPIREGFVDGCVKVADTERLLQNFGLRELRIDPLRVIAGDEHERNPA